MQTLDRLKKKGKTLVRRVSIILNVLLIATEGYLGWSSGWWRLAVFVSALCLINLLELIRKQPILPYKLIVIFNIFILFVAIFTGIIPTAMSWSNVDISSSGELKYFLGFIVVSLINLAAPVTTILVIRRKRLWKYLCESCGRLFDARTIKEDSVCNGCGVELLKVWQCPKCSEFNSKDEKRCRFCEAMKQPESNSRPVGSG